MKHLPLIKLFLEEENDTILSHILKVLLNFIDMGDGDIAHAIIGKRTRKRLLVLTKHHVTKVQQLAICVIGSITSYNDPVIIKILLTKETMDTIVSLLNAEEVYTRNLVCWVISNIVEGGYHYIKYLATTDAFVFLKRMMNHSNFSIRKEAASAVCNALMDDKPKSIYKVLQFGVIQQMISLLNSKDMSLLLKILDTIDHIFVMNDKRPEDCYDLKERFSQIGLAECLEKLQHSENKAVSTKAMKLLDALCDFANDHLDDTLSITSIGSEDTHTEEEEASNLEGTAQFDN